MTPIERQKLKDIQDLLYVFRHFLTEDSYAASRWMRYRADWYEPEASLTKSIKDIEVMLNGNDPRNT